MSSRSLRRPAGAVLGDARGEGRALRVTWHEDAGVVVLSVWRDNVCTATVRLGPVEAVDLIEALAAGVPREQLPPAALGGGAGAAGA